MLARIREFFISCSPLEFNLIARSTRCWRYLSRRYSRGMCLSLSLSLSLVLAIYERLRLGG